MARRPVSETGDTHARLRDVSFRLFGQFGYDGVSLLVIARQANLTKSALYGHFSGKSALYCDCMTQLVALFDAQVLSFAQASADPLARIIRLFKGLQHLSTNSRVAEGVAGYWLTPNSAAVPEARNVLTTFEAQAQEQVRAHMVAAQQAGQLKQNAPPEEIAQAFIAIMEAVVLPLGERDTQGQARLVGVLAKIFFEAYAPDESIRELVAGVLADHTPVPA